MKHRATRPGGPNSPIETGAAHTPDRSSRRAAFSSVAVVVTLWLLEPPAPGDGIRGVPGRLAMKALSLHDDGGDDFFGCCFSWK